MDKLILHTYQSKQAVKILHEQGVLYLSEAERSYTYLGQYDGQDHNPFDSAYGFMVHEMKRLLPPPTHECAYPLWAWYKCNGRYKPSRGLDKIHSGKIRLKVAIEPRKALLSDFDRFAYLTVGGAYFAFDEKQRSEFEKHLFEPDEYFYPNWREQVFSLHRKSEDEYGPSYRNETIQATFWELYLEDVLEEVEV